jgi:hypothetical protein
MEALLETLPALTHAGCFVVWEIPDFAGHQSVTELEVCADYHAAHEAEQDAINAQWRRECRRTW